MKEEGIIIKTTPYQESSIIIHILTDKGIKSVLARGAKKLKSSFRSVIANFNYVSFEATGKSLLTLQNADLLNQFEGINTNIKKNMYASMVADYLMHINLESNESKIYLFTHKILKLIDSSDELLSIIVFKLKMLYIIGVCPNFNKCLKCNSKNIESFSIKEGSVLCTEHQTLGTLDKDVTLLMKSLYYINLDQDALPMIDETLKRSLKEAVDAYYAYHVGFVSQTILRLNKRII